MPQTFAASTETDLNNAITSIDLQGVSGTTYEIDLGSNIRLTTDLLALNLPSGVDLVIQGNGHTLDGGGTYRGVFAYAGMVALESLTIANAVAQGGNGGNGAAGGGGGAGLGGGLFVASAATVNLSSVSFSNDKAIGGQGGSASGVSGYGGGGGLGGAGGNGSPSVHDAGGGGIGTGATGGSGSAAGAGIVPGVSNGGGGGITYDGGGIAASGGAGGFGGGGSYQAGGFGGGGGGGVSVGFNGGFGGGGGGNFVAGGAGGFGAGAGGGRGNSSGGGGLGAGGAVFVQSGGQLTIGSGSESGGAVQQGLGANRGQALGSGLLVQGGAITLDPVSGAILNIGDAIADASSDTNTADGSGPASLVMIGAGRVVLNGTNSFSGGITIDAGTVELGNRSAAGAGSIRIGPHADLVVYPVQSGNTYALPVTGTVGLQIGGTIDLPSVTYQAGASVTANGNQITLTSGGTEVVITLDSSALVSVEATSDTAGRTELLGINTITVQTEAALNAAITALDIGGTPSWPTPDSIVLGADIALTTDLLALNLPSGADLVIDGNGHTINGGGTQHGFFAYAGSVTLDNLTIENALALGGVGGTGSQAGGGGGAGLGGGLFVASKASVTLGNVFFSGDRAVGGAGGGFLGSGIGAGGGLGGAGSSYGGGGIGTGATGAKSITGPGGAGIVPGVPGGGGGGYGNGGNGTGGGINPSGAAGGFGGGGAGTGQGGFGGGGSGASNGGFGGGGGASDYGGFGGGIGASYGGGGLGAGGAVFVQAAGGLVLGGGTISGGSVTGGLGGLTSGQALGNGLFVQKGVVTLDPAAGITLTIRDAIADASSDRNQADGSGPASLAIMGAGRVVLGGSNSFTGGIALGAGTVELASGSAAGSGAIQFNAPATLVLDNAALGGSGAARSFASAIAGFGNGAAIDIAGLFYGGTATTTVATAGTVAVIENGTEVDLAVTGASVGKVFQLAQDSGGGTTVACFAEGTRIATARGEVAVESLRVGDKVRTASGTQRAVVWLGHRRTDCARHARPWDVMPVRVCADAFGPGQPARDVVLSPDHAVLVEDALIPVRYLLNGASVVQERVDAITYWHVELDAHDVLLAEGLPCESYLDTGNRSAFANGGPVVQAHPEFARAVWAGRACAPLVTDGPRLVAAKRALIARLPELGFAISNDPELRVLVDGRAIEPQHDGAWTTLALPHGARRLTLLSRTTQPALLDPDRDDMRTLGLSLRALRIDGVDVPLDDARFGEGWHGAECGLRWSDGAGMIDVRGVGVLELLAGPVLPHAVRQRASRRLAAAA